MTDVLIVRVVRRKILIKNKSKTSIYFLILILLRVASEEKGSALDYNRVTHRDAQVTGRKIRIL